MKMKKFKFWIRTSRGTDKNEIIEIPYTESKHEENIKYYLEEWCSKVYNLWHTSDARIKYGYKKL